MAIAQIICFLQHVITYLFLSFKSFPTFRVYSFYRLPVFIIEINNVIITFNNIIINRRKNIYLSK